ncbi:MAG: magnesium transporter [Candidatus Pacebacteria bacterium]|jgi:magnesium transporter|nr:magnesium transporter [Candidatus Paceibacterota bacterium]
MNEVDVYTKQVTYRPQERVALLRGLTIGEQSAILQSVSAYVQQQVLRELTDREVIDILDHVDLQAAQKLVTRIRDTKRREKIIAALKADIKDKIEYFLRFHPKATFSLIHFNYVFVPANTTIGEAGGIIETHYEETGKFPEILVHESGVLLGEVPFGVLVRERSSAPLEKFVVPVTTISYQAEIGDIIDTITSSGKRKVVILDHDSSVLGIVYADDALELFGHMPTESLYSFTGVVSSERPFDSATRKFRNRIPWLVLNLFTAFLAGGVVLTFNDTIDALALLAVYMPIVAGMGGNASSQTFAVMMRGITLGSIKLETALPAIKRELLAAVMNGLVIASIVAVISVVWNGSWMLGLVVGITMIFAHCVAGLFGALVPLVIKRLGFDPATMSMVFVSTATDVLGLLCLLGLGTLFLL